MYHKRKKNKVVRIESADEAVEKVENQIHGWEDDTDLSDMNMNNLRALIRKVWEDAYEAGREEANSDAAISAAEAEWFGG